MFVFEEPADTEGRAATAGGQLRDDGTGEATDEAALDPPK
jgi:hypothetical protein